VLREMGNTENQVGLRSEKLVTRLHARIHGQGKKILQLKGQGEMRRNEITQLTVTT